jgi:hypothetical protein
VDRIKKLKTGQDPTKGCRVIEIVFEEQNIPVYNN